MNIFRLRVHKGVEWIEGEFLSALSTTLYVMVDRVKGGGRAPQPTPGWADFTIMRESTPETGHCHSVCTLWFYRTKSVIISVLFRSHFNAPYRRACRKQKKEQTEKAQ